jgi:hypothetical protein
VTVLPVVVFVVEGASFEYRKVSRPKNGIVANRSVLEPRRLREALVVRVCFLLVGGGVPILLRELLTAGLVLLGSYIMRRRPPTWSPTGGLVQWRQWTLEPVLLGERFKRAVGGRYNSYY